MAADSLRRGTNEEIDRSAVTSGGLLRKVVEALEIANIRYMVVGSFASTFHSAPRMTRDIDFVIAASPETIEVFVEQFERNRFYVDDAVLAVRSTSMFNVIDTETGWKADLIIQRNRAFSVTELDRRQRAVISGVDTWVATAEDTILSKLEWHKKSGSDQQLRDVTEILLAQGRSLDRAYMRRCAKDLNVDHILQDLENGTSATQ